MLVWGFSLQTRRCFPKPNTLQFNWSPRKHGRQGYHVAVVHVERLLIFLYSSYTEYGA